MNEAIKSKIEEYLETLDQSKYLNIFAMINQNEVTKNRLLDEIAHKLLADPDNSDIEDIIDQYEISLDLM